MVFLAPAHHPAPVGDDPAASDSGLLLLVEDGPAVSDSAVLVAKDEPPVSVPAPLLTKEGPEASGSRMTQLLILMGC